MSGATAESIPSSRVRPGFDTRAIGDDPFEGSMSANEHTAGDFIRYPTNRVVGTISDANDARVALHSLLDAGFEPADIDILHGEKDLSATDPWGTRVRIRVEH